MPTARRDLLVGLFILVTVGIVAGVMILTSGVLERRYRLYMRTASAEGLTQDTRVYLRGYQIGRVQQINPSFAGGPASIGFIATLLIRDEFPDGTPLRLPAGTRARITQPTAFVGSPVIELEVPADAPDTDLAPGDTIESRRVEGVMGALGDVAGQLADEITTTLEETRRLMSRAGRTLAASNELLTSAQPRLNEVLERLAANLERTDQLLTTLEPQVGTVTDSLLATLSQTRRVLVRLDSLATAAHEMATENRPAIAQTIEHLHRSSVILEHFADRISRRPLRFLTGITPPADTSQQQRP